MHLPRCLLEEWPIRVLCGTIIYLSTGLSCLLCIEQTTYRQTIIMPPTLKKLKGHIAFGASVSGCVGAWVTLFVPTVTFKPLKLES